MDLSPQHRGGRARVCSEGGGRHEEGGREEESRDRRRSETEGRVGGEGAEGVGTEEEGKGEGESKGGGARGRTVSTPEAEGRVRGGRAQFEKAPR